MDHRPTRRQVVLSGTLAVAAALAPTRIGRAASPDVLEARTARTQLLDAGNPATEVWAYDGRVPGPTVRVRQGEEVRVRLLNSLPEPTTIHWHGIRLDNDMDGVAHLTQHPVVPGDSFDYRFVAPDAGTYWYHPHVHGSGPQVERGLSGALIVDETEPPDVDRDHVLMVKDWRLREDGVIDADSFGNLHDASHAGRLGNILTVNGRHLEVLAAAPGERLRLRFISSANARVMRLDMPAVAGAWLMALDGQPVEPRPLDGAIVLAPSQRADVFVDIPETGAASISIREATGEPFEAARIDVAGGGRRLRAVAPARLPANPVPLPGSSPGVVDLVMTGGAMRFLERATYRGAEIAGRPLALDHGMLWAFNGTAGMPDVPLLRVRRGEDVALRIVNDTLWPHAMHVHGHHFVELERNGGAPQPGLRDTVLLEADETVTIAFNADNPGRWMIHCHMLEHQATGMETWFEVVG